MNKKNSVQYLNTIICIVLSLVWMMGCTDEIGPGNTVGKSSVSVKTDVAVAGDDDLTVFNELMGTVSPKTEATISAKVMGVIRQVKVNEGDTVQAGDVLVTVEDQEITARYRQAAAGFKEAKQWEKSATSGLNAAKAGYNLSAATYKRYQSLMKNDSVSRQEFEEVAAKYHQASSAVAAAKSQVKAAHERTNQAKESLAAANSVVKDTKISAPFNGAVKQRFVDPGDLATPGSPLLKLEEIGGFEVHFELPESHIDRVGNGDTLSVVIPSLKEASLKAKVVVIDSSADPNTRTFLIKAALPAIPGMRSGVFARVMIPEKNGRLLLIPKSSILSRGQLTGVFLLDKENTARWHLVRTGRIFGEKAEIVSGLNNKDRYIIKPDHRIADGVKVEAP